MPTATAPAQAPPLLRVRGLSVTFATPRGPVRAVRDVDLDVAAGEVVALLGESGSGKSVTARAVMGLRAPGATVEADVLSLGGTDVRAMDEAQLRPLRGRRMSLVFQDALSALNPVLSVGAQIAELLRVHTGASRPAARARAVEMLSLVGIPAPARRVDDYPHQFSGGMRQRILIAMAICLEPELLIADEPTTALDVTVQAQILELLDTLRQTLGMGVLLITHDLGVVCEVADRLAVMYAGRVVESGAADDVLVRPAHPYTEALLRSVPQAEALGGALRTIPGSPPSPARLPTGCSFHPRCGWAVQTCTELRPELRAPAPDGRTPVEHLAPDQRSACHRAEEVLGAAAC